MSELDKGSQNIGLNVESKEGERGPLSSNNANERSPSLNYHFIPDEENLNAAFDVLFNITIRNQKQWND